MSHPNRPLSPPEARENARVTAAASNGGAGLARPQNGARQRWHALLWGAGLMLCLLVVLGLAVQSNFRRLQEANQWNVHTYQVLSRIDRVRTLLDAHEAQLRGFALTGDAQFLAQLTQSNSVGVRALHDLEEFTSDRASQQRRLSLVKPQFLAYKARFVTPYMGVKLNAARSEQIRGRLREQTVARRSESARLQKLLRSMESTERELIDQRARELALAQAETARTLLGCSVFVVLLAVVLTILLARSVQAQGAANSKLTELNASLVSEISERRTVEESLRASETGFRHLAEDSLDMICRHAPDGTLTYVSPAAWPLLGYSPTEMVGVHPGRFLFDKETRDEYDGISAETHFAALLRDTHHKPLLRSYRHARGQRVWLEIVGHAIVDSESGEVRAWHSASRDVSARVREEKERARLLAGLRAVVEIADELITAPSEEALLKRAVEMMVKRIGLKRCSIYLSVAGEAENEAERGNPDEFSPLMRGTWGTGENGRAVAEDELFYDTHSEPDSNDITPNPGERWIVRADQVRYLWREGERVELPGRGWLARTPIATRNDVIGLFFHDSAPTDEPHDAVDQQLIAVFCSLLGALIERGRSQARMNRQQRLLQSVMENAPLFLYSVDCDERFTLATGNVLPVIGFNPTDMIGQKLSEIMPVESASVMGMRRALQGESMQQEMMFANRWLKMWRQPIRDEAGAISGMIGIGMDLTQQHRAQSALRESETRYRQVSDALQDVLFQTDSEGHWTFLNPAWSEITGHSVESSLSAACARAIVPEDRAVFAALLEEARQSPGVDAPARVLRFNTKSGEVRHLEVALRANFGGENKFGGTAGTLRDVTEKVRADAALRETLQMKRAILQGASYAIVSTNAGGIIQSFNAAAETLFGVKADEVIGKVQPTGFYSTADIEESARALSEELGEPVEPGFETLVALARRGGKRETEWNCQRPDGTIFPMRISHAVLRDGDGQISGYVSIGYDLTETRRAEKLKNEFVSVVSHELRTPLTSIRGALGLLSGGVAGELPASASQMIGIAQKNADRLVLLINDILDIEKIESGKMRFEMGEISLAGLLQTALESNRGYAQSLGVELELEPLPLALHAATLVGDEPRLQQVMSNLLSNACKWTPKGSAVRLRALIAPGATPDNPRVSIEVRDAGPGVPPEFESRLFERFSQADGSATREKGGTGLGLAVTLAIVEKHGGTIAYRAPDVPNGRIGATFHFELAAQHLAWPAGKNSPKRLLVIEDDEDVAALLTAILRDAGYAVEVAHSRAQALRIAGANAGAGGRFDGATLDLNLPDGDGLELLEELRQMPATRDLPVVVVSSFCTEAIQKCAPDDIAHWLGKPVAPQALLSAIASWHAVSRVEGDGSGPASGSGKARVLHVEDDGDVRHVVAMILGDSSEIVTASTLARARACLQGERFDLALLDIGLPDGNGLDLLEDLNGQTPPIPTIIFSAREEEAETASNVAAALIKSRSPNDVLRAKVEEVLGRNGDGDWQ